jgi:hypothetical protein
MDAAERALLDATVRDAIARAAPRGAASVDDALGQLGWPEMLNTEARDVVEIVFRALGAAGGNASALDDVAAYGLGTEPRSDLAVVLPPFASWEPPGSTNGERVSARGLATARASTARRLLVVCADGSGLSLATVPAAAAHVRAVQGLDADAGFQLADLDGVATDVSPLEPGAWDRAVALDRRALADQMAGATGTMLDLAREHALERVQFDRPIARFQAVRHRLAEALVALEALDATLGAAADEPGPVTAALAKAVAGRSARTVGAHCQQVLAGVGFTTDHPFHRYLKRTMTLDGILGTADDVTLDVGRRVLADRHVPTLVEL